MNLETIEYYSGQLDGPNQKPIMPTATLLLIEDETAIAENVIYALETEGFAVIWQQFGLPGLQVLKDKAIDLIILDVGLPDISGFDLCQQIRTQFTIPIIFLTARSDEIDRVVGLEIGGDDYVSKPFSPRELSARVKVILRRSRNGYASNSGVDFTIDHDKNQISYQGTVLKLTRYEYLILKTLLHQPERVFSRDQLIERLWDNPEASFDRAVDTHIKTLRAKLKKVSEQDPIQTHRGFGYSIQASRHEL